MLEDNEKSNKKILYINGIIILNECNQVCDYFIHYFQHFQVVILCPFYLGKRRATWL
ncbi:unnamed protein product [Tenebrio molitor]|nr:unnamed protein product [Tenebrio molitor]